jgi:general secretion pathway protein G
MSTTSPLSLLPPTVLDDRSANLPVAPSARPARPPRPRRGFTLIEVLLVLVILTVIAGLVIVNVGGTQDAAFGRLARTQLRAIGQQLEQYRLEVGSYPSSLDALFQQPSDIADPSLWRQISQKPIPPDPWGRPYQYKLLGDTYEIRSLGKDGIPNTENDIVSD